MTSIISTTRKTLDRWMALAGFVGALGATYFLLALPLHTHLTETIDSIAAERALAARLRMSLASDSNASLPPRVTTGVLRLDGANETLAAVQLQAHVNALLNAAGVDRFRSARPRPAVERNGVSLIGIDLGLAADLPGLQRFLVGLEAARPLLILDSLQISPGVVAIRDASAAARQLIDVRLTVLAAVPARRVARTSAKSGEVADVAVSRP